MSAEPLPPKAPDVFISYSHDSDDHVRRVADFAARLADDGCDVRLDLYEHPDDGWPNWMRRQVQQADFTVVVCTERYRARFEQSEPLDSGKGARMEGAMITQQIYDAHMRNRKVLPVLFDGESADVIPEILKASSYWHVDEEAGYERFYARLQNKPVLARPPKGTLRPPKSTLSTTETLYGDAVLPSWDMSSKGLAGRDQLRTNLPSLSTQFVGRSAALAETRANVHRFPVVTLTGPAGTGKTRLALAAAESLIDDFRDGVWWVEVGPTSDERELAHTVAQAAGLAGEPEQGSIAALIEALRHAQLLLVLDNCERRLSDVATLIDNITRSCRDVRILTTSREALGATAEAPQPVRPLTFPAPRDATVETLLRSEAGTLFTSRAKQAESGFRIVSDDDARAVARMCEATFGVPLAIELAAGAVRESLVSEISTGIAEQVELLGPAQRERVLDAVIRWAHARLDEQHQVLWQRLSVFHGGFGMAAVRAVCVDERAPGELLDGLFDDLMTRFLVVEERGRSTGDLDAIAKRYRQLESLCHFARRRLIEAGDMPDMQRRHAEYYLSLAEETRPRLRQEDQKRWLQVLEAEHDNFRTAIDWFVRREDVQSAMRLSGALGRFWHMRGYWREGRAILREVLALPGADDQTSARAAALIAKGHLAFVMSDYPEAMRYYEDALAIHELSGDANLIADAKHRVAIVAEVFGELQWATELQEAALDLARKAGNLELQADVLHHLGVLAGNDNRPEDAEAPLREAFELRRGRGDVWGEAWSLVVLGGHYRVVGHTTEAREAFVKSLELYESQGDRRRIASSLNSLAALDVTDGAHGAARDELRRATEIVRDLGDLRGLAEALECWASLAVAENYAQRAYTLVGAADGLRTHLNAKRTPQAHRWLEASLRPLEERTPRRDSMNWRAEGHRQTPEQAARYAMEITDGD